MRDERTYLMILTFLHGPTLQLAAPSRLSIRRQMTATSIYENAMDYCEGCVGPPSRMHVSASLSLGLKPLHAPHGHLPGAQIRIRHLDGPVADEMAMANCAISICYFARLSDLNLGLLPSALEGMQRRSSRSISEAGT